MSTLQVPRQGTPRDQQALGVPPMGCQWPQRGMLKPGVGETQRTKPLRDKTWRQDWRQELGREVVFRWPDSPQQWPLREQFSLNTHLQLGPAWPGRSCGQRACDYGVCRPSCPPVGLSRVPSEGSWVPGAALRSTTVFMKMRIRRGCQSRSGGCCGTAPPPGPQEGLWGQGRPPVGGCVLLAAADPWWTESRPA